MTCGAAPAVAGGTVTATCGGFTMTLMLWSGAGELVPGARGMAGFGPFPAEKSCHDLFQARKSASVNVTLRLLLGAASEGRSVHDIGRSPCVRYVSRLRPLLWDWLL